MNNNQKLRLKKILKPLILEVKSEIRSKKRLKEATQTPEYRKFLSALNSLIKLSEVVGKQSENDELWSGSEGNEISNALTYIWNGFATGNHRDKSAQDEIFK